MKRVKQRIFTIIQPSNGHDLASSIFDWFIIVLISVNVLLVVLDTFSGFSVETRQIFYIIEEVSVAIFTLEYLLRFWTADCLYPNQSAFSARMKYSLSFMAVIDLLAILPFICRLSSLSICACCA